MGGWWFALIIVISIVVIFSLFSMWIYLKTLPAGAQYPLVHNYPSDFYYYLSYVQQGREGTLLVTSRYTSELYPRQFVFTFFPLLGLAARLFGVSNPLIYTLARSVSGGLLLITSSLLAWYLFKQFRMVLCALALVIIGAPLWYLDGSTIRQWGEYWTGFDVMLRIAFLPHHMTAYMMIPVILILLARGVTRGSVRYSVSAGIVAAVALWIHPAASLVVLVSTVPAVARRAWGNLRTLVIASPAYLLPVIPAVGYAALSRTSFPWNAVSRYEQLVTYPVGPLDYIGILGVVGILALIGVLRTAKKRIFLWDLTCGWLVVPFVLPFIIPKFITISEVRFLQAAPYVPAAMLALEGFRVLVRLGSRAGIGRKISAVILIIIIAVNGIGSFGASILRQLRYVSENRWNPLVFIPNDLADTISFLSPVGYADDVVLADGIVSALIPAFTNKRVVYGHPLATDYPRVREQDVYRFFSTTDPADAAEIVKQYRVRYIVGSVKTAIQSGMTSVFERGPYRVYLAGTVQ